MLEQIISAICIVITLVVSTWAIVVIRMRTRKYISWANAEKTRIDAEYALAKDEIDRAYGRVRSAEKSGQGYIKINKREPW